MGEKLKFLDLFSGIGGFRLGMEMAGHEAVGWCEIDKFARKSYEAMHNTEGEWTASDITKVSDNDIRLLAGKRIDVICGGFPCQAFSVAGKRGGFSDTRGTLFFEIARIAKQVKPRFLFLENVKGILSHEKGKTFATILNTLDELGYDAEWQVLNSKDFGVPQNRERVFIIGHLRGTGGREIFPIRGENKNSSSEFRTKLIDDTQVNFDGIRVYDDETPTLRSSRHGLKILDDQGRTKKKHKLQDYAPTLRRESHGNDPKVVVVGNTGNGHGGYDVYSQKGLSPTLKARDYKGPVQFLGEKRIRKLTPKECFRLQGFPDWAFERAEQVNSNSQLYKQAGNSVTVNVIYEIARRLEVTN